MARYAWRLFGLVILSIALLSQTLASAGAQSAQHVDVATLDGEVDSVSANYLVRAMDTAARDGAQALIITMNTPGGLDTAMRDIIAKMLSSPVPIVVYVSPAGARAASAGVFISMAAHVAAMEPTTNIGSAHPVSGTGADIPGDLGTKITNDAVAYIQSIAEKRGRNAAWAADAVRNSVNITADEAVQQKVVDLTATDMRDLLTKLDGRTVTTAAGPATLHTADAAVEPVEETLLDKFLHFLTDPTVAYLLLTVGIWALIAEFANPGAILPAVTGVICLILAFIAFQSLPVNVGGILLIVLSVVLFILDVKAPTHGILTIGGIISFILGSLILFNPSGPPTPAAPADVHVPWPWIALMAMFSAAVFSAAVTAGLRAQRRKVTVGVQTLQGATGVARSDLDPNGVVLINAEDWTAVAVGGHIRKGQRVRVVGRNDLVLQVELATKGQAEHLAVAESGS